VTWTHTDVLTRKSALDYGASLIGVRQLPLPTGIDSWDGACDETGGRGLGDWWYVVIGGASNSGKTQLMMHLTRKAAEAGLVPGIVTMEVPRKGLQRRLYSNLTNFTYYDFLPHHWEKGQPDAKVEKLGDQVGAYRMMGDDERAVIVAEQDAPPTLNEIMVACDELVEAGCGCIFLDHLQLIKAPADQVADRATEISEALRWFAHGRKKLVIALSQLNRLASRERDRRPTMHDLLGGTSIESNSNQVVLLDHSNQERDAEHPHILRTWLFLDKNREGTNRLLIPVEVNFRTGVWREAKPDEIEDWPGGRA
jgi:replicative DNA helicase